MKQRGFLDPALLIAILVIISVVVGGYLYIKYDSDKRNTHVDRECAPGKMSTKESPCIQDEEATLLSSEINDLPVYPDAKFVEKSITKPGDDPKCEPGNTAPACVYGTTTYTYTTTDSWQKVNDWYNSNSEWKFSGGAGATGSSTATYTKGEDKIQVNISENLDNNTTSIFIEVSNKM